MMTATDAWADVCIVPTDGFKTRTLTFTAVYNTLNVRLLCSADGGTTYPLIETASFAVTTAASVVKTSTTACTHLKVQVQPAVSETHGTIQTQWLETSY